VLFIQRLLLKSTSAGCDDGTRQVSVLFNEPKLLKSFARRPLLTPRRVFQCSSTSRNC